MIGMFNVYSAFKAGWDAAHGGSLLTLRTAKETEELDDAFRKWYGEKVMERMRLAMGGSK